MFMEVSPIAAVRSLKIAAFSRAEPDLAAGPTKPARVSRGTLQGGARAVAGQEVASAVAWKGPPMEMARGIALEPSAARLVQTRPLNPAVSIA